MLTTLPLTWPLQNNDKLIKRTSIISIVKTMQYEQDYQPK